MSQALKLVLAPLLIAQGRRVRRTTPLLPEAAGARRGVVGDGPPLRLLIAGDSSAAGVGVTTQQQGLAGQAAEAAALACGARVHWQLVARTGIDSAALLPLLREQAPDPADVAVIVTGVNDVTAQVPPERALRARTALLRWLLDSRLARHAVFTALPPMQHFRALPQPLRWVAGLDARRHDRALARWAAAEPAASHLPFAAQPADGILAADGFHPGEAGYRLIGQELGRHLATVVRPRLH